MSNYIFDKFKPDAIINYLGSLCRRIKGSRWWISISFSGQKGSDSVTLSNASAIARKRVVNPTCIAKAAGSHINLSIISTKGWCVKKIKDCPIEGFSSRKDCEQFCFVLKTKNGLTIYLPQLELARALFFRDSYLARAAMEPDTLDFDFQIVREGNCEVIRINIMPTSCYPLELFRELSSRNYLSWILLDDQARKSYESIGRNQKTSGYQVGDYWKWDFHFDPPELPDANLGLRGYHDKKTKCFFVYEIESIKNISANIPEKIEMYHPNFNTPSAESTHGGTSVAPSTIDQYNVHDDEVANADAARRLIDGDKVVFEFSKPFVTLRVSEKKKPITSQKPQEEGGDSHHLDVSAEESVAGQGFPGGEWDTTNDQTENDHLFESKFSCFLNMVENLVDTHDCKMLSKNTRKLPAVSRCKKHLLSTDGNPRCMAVVVIEVKGKVFHLLEVDTSDADKPLSTRILMVRSYATWEKDLEHLEYELVRTSLTWPVQLLTQFCGKKGHLRISHPKTPSNNKGLILPDSIEGWANRTYDRMDDMSQI
ncbi:Tn7-like element transposition protein TnsE [Desulfovibrio gilichinskyi]|uniref:TnsE C-terminal domain-containing protein n=1 Tax=Desulfovibrio gilichinskyi TaxID=1519643 RepID=A0A1X7EIW0_9BACT|nr:Tn7-like element transposition protein TnsE [Desulfovibrio gilichinskyi]SMF34644.1 hypothetical protein SAMN06295933_3020 [Desulfovibrio gilichinskyi]